MARSRKHPDLSDEAANSLEAAEHDAWFRAEVQKALDSIENGTMRLIDEEEWKIISARERAELLRLIAEQDR
ncbi:hypothetical protein [Phyllobacterium leguminum]|uniref:Uncharacterized protein n=1 Tax=Phyllobacterium leguminum TaxID=314237 RepID=A0A318T3E6_9HYPH|nr:hypothetical protein [Phyllobacterium leguminum]PYE88512.1 hypothetical protein C7477_107155 [Phyllobacterium leguminum]